MKIVIPGIPVPQARMRHFGKGNFVRLYDPKAKEKTAIRGQLERFKQEKEISYPRLSFIFYMPIPSSIPKKLRPLYESERLKHDKKPDADNLIKLYLDCLDGIVLQGDQKVSLGGAIKIYSPNPRTIVYINEMQNQVTSQEIDCIFLFSEEHDIPSFSEKDFQHDFYTLGKTAHLQSLHKCAPCFLAQSSSDKLYTLTHPV